MILSESHDLALAHCANSSSSAPRSGEQLPDRLTLVDGCFDPLHPGHIAYFRAAAELGLPVLCNVAPDRYLLEHKHRAPLLCESDRLALLDSIRWLDYVVLARHGTAASLRRFRPAYYVKGCDWRGRLPADQVRACEQLGTEIIYVDCALNASSRIVETFLTNAHSINHTAIDQPANHQPIHSATKERSYVHPAV